MTEHTIEHRIALELGARPAQVMAAVQLLDEGATVPFIARYRKEVTGALDDTQLRTLEERLTYLRELETRREAILGSILEQGKLTPELKAEILAAETKQRLEDLYLPYKQKRRTKAQIAREAGIEPLALTLLQDPALVPETEAEKYLNAEAGFTDAKTVLDGARQILMEQFAEDAELLGQLREYLNEHGYMKSTVVEGKENEGAKFRDWFDFAEPIAKMPSHRALALFRGRNEGMLSVSLILDSELNPEAAGQVKPGFNPCEQRIAARFGVKDLGRPADKWLNDTVRWAWKVKIFLHLELELMNALRERAEEEAIRIFASNLKDLLLAAPAGAKCTLGLDPGIRTGCKVAVVDATGKLLGTTTIYPHEPRNDWNGSISALAKICKEFAVQLIAIGNGTASRETDKLAAELMQRHPELKLAKIVVSEAGASVYSASEFAAREFPELDVSLRGAVSIARRLQDPLAELVKIDPKSIGVGQYQHDVSQSKLAKSLDAVVEDCVNAVGVDVNTASAPLLARISGLNATLAANIVNYRDANGAFKQRGGLKKVPRLGEKTFEQAAGFLRILNGDNPLDASAVHPEAYPVVEKILVDLGKGIKDIIGSRLGARINPIRYTDEQFGLPTVQDILKELEKPGRDPRPEFKTATFAEGITGVKDLQPGMILEGVVTNVAAFGAFVDIGVHQDGLVHISCLSDKFIKDPRDVVKAGAVVKVKVLEVDMPRGRISLTLRLSDDAVPVRKEHSTPRQNGQRNAGNAPRRQETAAAPTGSAMAAAFARLKQPS
ncbi:RNA-binding transcriptional accessory protein [Betaproteobacteria bacterium]|nr:RNA-binding transcriptional accessory protein [Betaproteobacteria bacterium]